MARILCLALFLLSAPARAALLGGDTEAGSRRVYLLAAPLAQEVKGSCATVGAIWAMNLSWTLASVGGAYLCFHDPVSAGLLAAWGLSQDVLYSASEVRTANQLVARWRRRSDLRRIAKATRAQQIRVITAGSSRRLGFFNATLDSRSFVFVETTGDRPPPAYEGREWLRVGDVENTKVRLRLGLPGYERELPVLEISLGDLFRGVRFPAAVEKAWRRGLRDWNARLPFRERYVTRATFEREAKVTAELVKGGEALALGDYATGSGIRHLLGMGRLRRLRRFLDETLLDRDRRETGPWLGAQDVEVHGNAGCSKWYRRLSGKEILVHP